ncbi:hypothetical protein BE21_57590 [Sorangium cellulosum]|uniref:Uncharacterized protein n=1 Tax=Sorangium cellulosum TaxID=56 RepID=A0A150U3H7_SORCE|nr:hypothetical protein BE21_57590 [Sorangium cellulosum]
MRGRVSRGQREAEFWTALEPVIGFIPRGDLSVDGDGELVDDDEADTRSLFEAARDSDLEPEMSLTRAFRCR